VEDAMTILEHRDARARLVDAFEPADKTLCGFPGPSAATSTSQSTRFDNARQCVNDRAGRRDPKLGAAEAMASVREGLARISVGSCG
jgi:hypothetical protein